MKKVVAGSTVNGKIEQQVRILPLLYFSIPKFSRVEFFEKVREKIKDSNEEV